LATSFVVGATAFLLYGCEYCSDLDSEIEQAFKERDTVMLRGADILPEAIDSCHIITGPRFPEEINEIVDVHYTDVLQDDHTLYLYFKEGAVVESEEANCRGFDYSDTSSGDGGAVLRKNSRLEIWRSFDDYYRVFINKK
jgi:hypothetical protein